MGKDKSSVEYASQIEALKKEAGSLGSLPPMDQQDPLLSMMKQPEPFYAPLPNAPAETNPSVGTGTKIARAAILLLSGASGDPQLPARLSAQFAQQDDDARTSIQEDFRHRLAVAIQQHQDVQSQVANVNAEQSLALGNKQEARLTKEDAANRAQQGFANRLAVLKAMQDQRQLELEQERIATGKDNDRKVREIDLLQSMRQGLEISMKLVKQPTGKIDTLQILSSQTPEEQKMGNAGFAVTRDRLITEREKKYNLALNKSVINWEQSPAVQLAKSSLSDYGRMSIDVTTAAISQNDFTGAANGSVEAIKADPEAASVTLDAVVKQYVAEGRFPDYETGMSKMSEIIQKGEDPSLWKVPAPGTYTGQQSLGTGENETIGGKLKTFSDTAISMPKFHKRER